MARSRLTHILATACLCLPLLTLPLAAQDGETPGPSWVLDRGVWQFVIPLPPPVEPPMIDQARVNEVMQLGCSGGAIRFGDTAAMRDVSGTSGNFSDAVRDLASAATLTDDADQADAFLQQALDTTPDSDPVSLAHLQSLRVLTLLQHGRDDAARQALSQIDLDSLDGPTASDMLFWRALLEAPGASAQTWQDTLDPTLNAAFEQDRQSFQVLVWRVISWLEANADTPLGGASCAQAGRALSDRLLDLSAAGACPLMLGHMDMTLARHFRQRTVAEPASGPMIWRQFSSGLLSVIARDTGNARALEGALALSDDPCGVSLGAALMSLREGLL